MQEELNHIGNQRKDHILKMINQTGTQKLPTDFTIKQVIF